MKNKLLLFLAFAILAQTKTMAADTMSPQVFRDTVVVQADSLSRHHRCATESKSPEKVLWVIDGKVYNICALDAEDLLGNPSGEELIERTFKRNGIDCGKIEKFTVLPSNVAMSVYPDYGELQAAIIITTEKGNLNKKKEE